MSDTKDQSQKYAKWEGNYEYPDGTIGNMMERPQDRRTLDMRVHQIMSRNLHTIEPGASVQVAADRMIAAGVSCLPVVDAEGKPLGIVTWKDLLAAYIALAPLPAGS